MDPNEVTNMMGSAVDSGIEMVASWGLSVVGAILVLLVGRWIAGMVRKGTNRSLQRSNVDEILVPFISSGAYYVVIAIVIIAVLNLFGIQTTSLVAVLGAASLAIGLALQGTLSNFAAGTMLLVFRPFKKGDYVEVAGSAGSVFEVGIFTTVLNTPDNVKVTIPNSAVYGRTISNYSANPNRRMDLVMGISYGDDIDAAISTISDVLKSHPKVLDDPASTVAVAELADSSVNIVVRPWVRNEDYWPVRFELIHLLKVRIEAAGCSIPFPQRDLHLIKQDTGQVA